MKVSVAEEVTTAGIVGEKKDCVEEGEAKPEEQPKFKDNRCLAIIFINIFAISQVSQGLLWKIAAKKGAHIIDFQFMRSFSIWFFAFLQILCARINPCTAFPRSAYKDMVIRSLGGQFTFGLMNVAFALIALGTVSVILNTNAFWIAILGCLINKERVSAMEVFGMFLAFAGVVIIGYSKR